MTIIAMKEYTHPYFVAFLSRKTWRWISYQRIYLKSAENFLGYFCPWGCSESEDKKQVSSAFVLLTFGNKISGHTFVVAISC